MLAQQLCARAMRSVLLRALSSYPIVGVSVGLRDTGSTYDGRDDGYPCGVVKLGSLPMSPT